MIRTPAPPRAHSLDSESPRPATRVLLVDDDENVARTLGRLLERAGCEVTIAHTAEDALAKLVAGAVEVVVSDIAMPGMSGLDLLREFRGRDLTLPVLFVTGAPSLESAKEAIELGAFRYLEKPVSPGQLTAAVSEAAKVRGVSAATDVWVRDRAVLERALARAMATLRMVYQPLVSAESSEVIAYEALMRVNEPSFPSPPRVLEAAQKLGALRQLGRRVRNLVAAELERSPTEHAMFVNVLPSDLADPDLYDVGAPLTRYARQVVLEVTERESLEGVADLEDRLLRLRKLGFRLALDDLGTGYSGLTWFARLRPDVVKIDMSLVRGIDRDSVKQRIVRSMVALALGMDMLVVAEGVETREERDALVALGSTYLQGYYFAQPGAAYPSVIRDD